jgi:hypothetical protein
VGVGVPVVVLAVLLSQLLGPGNPEVVSFGPFAWFMADEPEGQVQQSAKPKVCPISWDTL